MRIGVLAVQGNFREHAAVLRGLGADVVEVRKPEQLDGLDGLVVPGGESTAIRRLIGLDGLQDAIARFEAPVLGTCAGMILLATEALDGRADQRTFGAIDLTVRRNGYGRQRDSFETDIDVDGVDGGPFRAVFIRAPVVERTGPGVVVGATVEGHPVLCRQGAITVTAFHPELSGDRRIHQRFLQEV
jgi:5'-phosphate synthase pdxT subunit